MAQSAIIRHCEATFKTEEEAMKELDMSKRICIQEACISSGYQYYEIFIRKDQGNWAKNCYFNIKVGFSHGITNFCADHFCELILIILQFN